MSLFKTLSLSLLFSALHAQTLRVDITLHAKGLDYHSEREYTLTKNIEHVSFQDSTIACDMRILQEEASSQNATVEAKVYFVDAEENLQLMAKPTLSITKGTPATITIGRSENNGEVDQCNINIELND